MENRDGGGLLEEELDCLFLETITLLIVRQWGFIRSLSYMDAQNPFKIHFQKLSREFLICIFKIELLGFKIIKLENGSAII